MPNPKGSSSEPPTSTSSRLLPRRKLIDTTQSNSSQAMPIPKAQNARNADETDAANSNSQTMPSPKVATEAQDAFQILMASKLPKDRVPKAQPATPAPFQQPASPQGTRLANPNFRGRGDHDRRNALGFYTANPQKIPVDLRVSNTDDFVLLKDLYPKSTVHFLLLFKNPRNVLHPFHFFEDPDILAKTKQEIQKIRSQVAKELEKKLGKFSAQDQKRQQILHGEITIPDGEELPKGRDWEKEVMVGVHAGPSMNHVHVHILSRDLYSDYLKKPMHYHSFSTHFFVKLEEFPLAADDPRWENPNALDQPGKKNRICWRCGRSNFKDFKNDFKQHLKVEYEEWRAE